MRNVWRSFTQRGNQRIVYFYLYKPIDSYQKSNVGLRTLIMVFNEWALSARQNKNISESRWKPPYVILTFYPYSPYLRANLRIDDNEGIINRRYGGGTPCDGEKAGQKAKRRTIGPWSMKMGRSLPIVEATFSTNREPLRTLRIRHWRISDDSRGIGNFLKISSTGWWRLLCKFWCWWLFFRAGFIIVPRYLRFKFFGFWKYTRGLIYVSSGVFVNFYVSIV